MFNYEKSKTAKLVLNADPLLCSDAKADDDSISGELAVPLEADEEDDDR